MVTVVALFGAGSFLVTAVSYVMGLFKIFSNFPEVIAVFSEFLSAIF